MFNRVDNWFLNIPESGLQVDQFWVKAFLSHKHQDNEPLWMTFPILQVDNSWIWSYAIGEIKHIKKLNAITSISS